MYFVIDADVESSAIRWFRKESILSRCRLILATDKRKSGHSPQVIPDIMENYRLPSIFLNYKIAVTA